MRIETWSIPSDLLKQATSTLLVAACLAAFPRTASADSTASTEQANIDFFEKKVRPLFVSRCQKCHGPQQQKGGLRLDSRRAVMAGGELGESVVPGQPEESLLVSAVRYGPTVQMPPDGKLPDADVAVLIEWVRRGAPWPDDDAGPAVAAPTGGPLFSDEQRSFWAFQVPADRPPPAVQNESWPVSALDRFVLARLESAGLAPAPRADKRTLLRRATFDLTGLPPSPEEIDTFLADDSPDAFAQAVDRLLASPAYGQRWGRHWLDVARYADSNGLDENLAYVNAYRYRDYVVSAFNRDLPYDQFVVEQLAGDLLPPSGEEALDYERLAATGLLTLGAKMLAEDDPVKMEMDIIDEQIDTVGVALMGMTLGCARCHDHKFDPIPSADYYSLAGIFKSTKTMDNFNVVAVWHERPLAAPAQVAAVEAHRQRVAEKKASVDRLVKTASEELTLGLRSDAWRYLQAAAELSRSGFSLKPRSSQQADRQPAGSVVVEAEDFTRGQATKLFDGYGAGIGVIASFSPEPSFAEYDVQLAHEGVYQIELRYAAADARPVRLSVDGAAIKPDAANQRTGSWNPDTQTWFAEALVALSPGKHTLRLERREPFPHFDRLAIVPVALPAGIEPQWFRAAPAEGDAVRPLRWGVLERWQTALVQAKNDPQHALHAWHVWNSSPDDTTNIDARSTASSLTASVLREPPPGSTGELVARYRELFERAEAAWGELQRSPGAEKPQRLDDPALETARAFLHDGGGPCAAPSPPETWFPAAAKSQLTALRDELSQLERSAPPALPLAMAVDDREVTPVRVHIRGNHLTQGAEVPRRFPRIMAGEEQPPLPSNTSGRLELARWLTRADHPLTSRVMVNRVWRGHFGEGLVRTPDNFGRLGERPTHPDLLDWLARRFVEDGWSLKSLHRRIMLSATYQMSSAYDARAAEIDPDNRLLWRVDRRRLEAEAVRDAILATSGRLDRAVGGSLLAASPRQYVASTTSVDSTQYDSFRRSIYLPVIRSALYDVFQAFDFAEPSVPNGSRAATTVAPQALFMMNGPLVIAETTHLADELLRQIATDDAARVQSLYRRAFARPADGTEVARALQFVGELESNTAWQALSPTERRRKAWQSLCRVVLSSNEFIYLE
ncbi:MAG TPA: DUF1553 domain-containing protein [Pirellulales bacterium]|nr:DUF1553 domain-containing protein [Pirellulales bacterium]